MNQQGFSPLGLTTGTRRRISSAGPGVGRKTGAGLFIGLVGARDKATNKDGLTPLLSGVSAVFLILLLLSSLTIPASASPVPVVAMPTRNWSGYALAGSAFTGVTGTFKVPHPLKSASCLEQTSIWVGVDGLYNHDLLQAGIAETGFILGSSGAATKWPAPTVGPILCGGGVHVYAWWEDLPSAPVWVSLPVTVGDSVTVSIFKMSPGWWVLGVYDIAARRSFLLAQPYRGPQTSVEWVVEAPQILGFVGKPIPFTTVDFRNLDADGLSRDVERFSFGSGHYLASPSHVLGGAAQLMRTGFTVRWAGTDE
jgi:hypothetical protein